MKLTKGDTMVLQGGGLWHGADDHIPIKKTCCESSSYVNQMKPTQTSMQTEGYIE